MSKIAIIGATGFTGIELLKLLKNHSKIKNIDLFSFSNAGKKIKDFSTEIDDEDILIDFSKIVYDQYDLVFFACPNGTAMNAYSYHKESDVKIIDLAADYRLDNEMTWEKYYGIKHTCPELLNKTVYGLTEINRKNIQEAKIVANPGCYPTAAILALFPLLKEKLIEENNIIIDAKSGFSGAGRKTLESGLSKNIQENFIPYNFYKHRHCPEITQELNKASDNNVQITFAPHILPIYRGILETIYAELKKSISNEDILDIYENFYKNDEFIQVSNTKTYEIKDIANTNNCFISIHKKNNKITLISTLDNLIKGAAGQAVQNMNIMFGFDETEALKNE